MLEGIVVLVGMCLTFVPVILFVHYLLTHVSKKTKFDYHIENVRDKNGNKGVFIAYIERVLFGIVISSLGVWMSDFFTSEVMLQLFILSLVFYVIVKYFDEKMEK